MGEYSTRERLERLLNTTGELQAVPLAPGARTASVSAHAPVPGLRTRALPDGERTERRPLALPAAPATPATPATPEPDFNSAGVMDDDSDPYLFGVTAYVARAARRDPWMKAPSAEDRASLVQAFDQARAELLAAYDRAAYQLFADFDRRWRQPTKELTS